MSEAIEVFGLKVVEDRFLPSERVLIVSDFPKPDHWDEWDETEQLRYAVEHGVVEVR